MKSKLLIFIIIVSVMLSIVALPVMASTKVVNITRPDGNEIVSKEVFSICGRCVYDETTIELEYKDKETGKFKPLYTTDGDSTFKVGSSKIFGKDVNLKYKGENVIKVIAYTKSTKDDPQENKYTITLTDEKKDNWFEDSITNITDTIKSWLGN